MLRGVPPSRCMNSKRKRFIKENVCYERFLTKVMSMLIGVRHLFEHSTLTCDLE